MTSKLRIVVFSAGEWTFDRDRIVRVLAGDERFDVTLIVLDEYRRSIWKRARFLLRIWGPWKLTASALASLANKIVELPANLLRRWHDMFVPPVQSDRPAVEQLNVPIARVPDINAPEVVRRVIDAAPDLGIILGGRILKSGLIEAPRTRHLEHP